MVHVLTPLGALSLVQVGAAAATAVALAIVLLVTRSRRRKCSPDDPTGTTSCTHAPRRLTTSLSMLLDVARTIAHPDGLPELVLRAAIAFDEQPWMRRVPGFADIVMVSKPEHVEDVVKTQQHVFVKSALLKDVLHETVGGAFFSLEGAAWLHQRKIAAKFFTPRVYRDVATTLIHKHTEILFALLDKACKTNEVVDLTRTIHAFTFQAFAELGFGLQIDNLGRDAPHPLEQAIDDSFSQTAYRVLVPPAIWKLQRFLNIGSERAYQENTTTIRRLVGELVHQSVAQTKHRRADQAQTLVELFIHAMRDGELEFSPELLCDLAVMFMIAGRDTTAGTLVWICYALGKHPEVVDKIRAELWEKVPQLMDGSVPSLTMEQAQTLTYLEAAIKETMRLYPLVPLTFRQADRDAVLVDGTFVGKGAIVGLSPYVTGRLASVWGDDVMEFKPERFLDDATGKLKTVSAFKFFGFLAGPRICIGMNLAMLEMKLVVAGLLSRFDLEIEPNDGRFAFTALMTLKAPLRARVRAVRPRAAAAAV